MLLRQLNGAMPATDGVASVRNVILNEMEAIAPILSYAQFYKMVGSSDAPQKEGSASGGTVRAINADFPDNTTAPDFASVVLRIFGDKVQTDEEWEARGGAIEDEHIIQLRSFAKNLGKDFQNRFVNDTLAATTWNGIKALVPAAQLFTFDDAGDGTVPYNVSAATKGQQQKFLEELDDLCSSIDGGAQLLLMDSKTKNRLRTIGRDYVQVQTIQNAIGEPMELTSFNGVPIVISGYSKGDAGLVIPHTETVADPSRTSCTSIYAMRFGEKADLSLATNVGLRVEGMKKETIFYTTRVHLSCGIVLVKTKALARMQGVVIS